MSNPDQLYNHLAAVVHDPLLTYPEFPYAPSEVYPELSEQGETQPENSVYGAVRQVLLDLGLDAEHAGTKKWNPFRSFIQPGQSVLIKPNWVRDVNTINPESIDDLVTHTAVLRPIIDYVLLALGGKGRVTVADAPLQDCNFESLMKKTRASELVDHYRPLYKECEFAVVDLRKTVWKRKSGVQALAQTDEQRSRSGDAAGYSLVNLGQLSLLTDIDDRYEQFRVTNYDYRLLREHHNREVHEYLVANAILDADVVINVPKLKCHIKAGLTGALKNLVGINGHKEYLPHHMNGSFFEGGDQYMYKSRLKQWHNRIYDHYWAHHREQSYWRNKVQSWMLLAIAVMSKVVDKENLYDGGWYGNETIPRTTIDLNHILYFYNRKTQKIEDKPVRTVFHLVDGVVSGEGHGPLQPTAKPVGVLIAGFNPLIVDLAMAKLIGYEPLRINTLFYGLNHKKSRLATLVPSLPDLSIVYNQQQTHFRELPNLGFVLPKFWRLVGERHRD